jgi:hypothetical protein
LNQEEAEEEHNKRDLPVRPTLEMGKFHLFDVFARLSLAKLGQIAAKRPNHLLLSSVCFVTSDRFLKPKSRFPSLFVAFPSFTSGFRLAFFAVFAPSPKLIFCSFRPSIRIYRSN